MPDLCRLTTVSALLLISTAGFAQTPSLDAGLRYRTHASGSMDDPYIEAPLEEEVRQYAPLLKLSNAVVERLISGEYGKIYEQYFSKRLKEEMSREWLVSKISEITAFAGPAQRYKKEQWRFSLRKHQGREILLSTKIVEHERAKVIYQLTVFPNQLTSVVGFHFSPMDRNARPELRAAFHSRDVVAAGVEHREFPPENESSAQSYAGLLRQANEILELCRKSNYGVVYGKHFSSLAKMMIDRGEYEGQAAQIINMAGPLQQFDPAEWHLEIHEYLGREFAVLTKTVRHERGTVLYRFTVFPEEPTKLIGIQMIPRELQPPKSEYFYEKDGEMVPVD